MPVGTYETHAWKTFPGEEIVGFTGVVATPGLAFPEQRRQSQSVAGGLTWAYGSERRFEKS